MRLIKVWILILIGQTSVAQMVPSDFEQITYLVTFGSESAAGWGDDDHSQVFFFVVPESFTKPVYIRVFDPEIGGTLDEKNGTWDTAVKFSVFAGKESYSHPDAQKTDPVGEYRSGTLIATKTFRNNGNYNEKWYSFGPFNPLEGERVEYLKGRVIKVVVDGIAGDDGNLYKFFLSTQANSNRAVNGSNAFTYEYSFRLPERKSAVAHLYPFVDNNVTSITQHNFDFDNEGSLLIYSIAKNRHRALGSANKKWAKSTHVLVDEEKNTTVDLQIVKSRTSRNDMVCFVTNQYDAAIPFFSVPIGGPPKFKYKVNVRYTRTK